MSRAISAQTGLAKRLNAIVARALQQITQHHAISGIAIVERLDWPRIARDTGGGEDFAGSEHRH